MQQMKGSNVAYNNRQRKAHYAVGCYLYSPRERNFYVTITLHYPVHYILHKTETNQRWLVRRVQASLENVGPVHVSEERMALQTQQK